MNGHDSEGHRRPPLTKPLMRALTPAEVEACPHCDLGCWFGCERPVDPPVDPMWCVDETKRTCDHGRSWTGVDDTPLNAPVKTWRCDDCGYEQDIPR